MAKDSEIKRLSYLIERFIEKQVAPIPAIPAIPSIPAIPAIPPIVPQNDGDHDILINFRAEAKIEFQNINKSLEKLNESADCYVNQTEHKEVVKKQEDQENRLRATEKFQQNWVGKMSVVGAATSVIISIVFLIAEHLIK